MLRRIRRFVARAGRMGGGGAAPISLDLALLVGFTVVSAPRLTTSTTGPALTAPLVVGCEAVRAASEATRPAGMITLDSADDRLLRLNLPAFRLDLVEAGAVRRSFPVAIGAPRYKSPTGDFEMVRLIWNPWWYPPDAEWARNEKITSPGPDNPMGKVKLLLRGAYYLHGTPIPSSIGKAASHGCIRMYNADAIELARIVQRWGDAAITGEETDSLIARARPTRVVELARPIRVRVVYELAEVRDSTLLVHPNIYWRRTGLLDELILVALASAGYDTATVNRGVVRAIAARRRTASDTVSLSEVLRSPVTAGAP